MMLVSMMMMIIVMIMMVTRCDVGLGTRNGYMPISSVCAVCPASYYSIDTITGLLL